MRRPRLHMQFKGVGPGDRVFYFTRDALEAEAFLERLPLTTPAFIYPERADADTFDASAESGPFVQRPLIGYSIVVNRSRARLARRRQKNMALPLQT